MFIEITNNQYYNNIFMKGGEDLYNSYHYPDILNGNLFLTLF